MIRYVSKKPMVAVIPPESQKDRVDAFYYHHFFSDLDDKLASASNEILPAEFASTLITDGTHQTPTYTEKEEGVLFLSSTNIAEHGVDLTEIKYITKELHQRLKNCQPDPGDVLIAKSGTVGVACVFPENFPECSVYESVAIFRPNEDWNPHYIAAFINSDLGIRQIQRSQKGIAIKHLHLGDLKELSFPKISEEDQTVLISRLSFIAEMHRKLSEECKNLVRKEHVLIRRKIDSIFAGELCIDSFYEAKQDLFFLRESKLAERLDVTANHPDYTKLVYLIKQSSLSGKLSDLVDVVEDRFDPRDWPAKEVSYLAIGDIDGETGKIISPQVMLSEDLPSRARRSLKAGTILVGIAGASTGKENMVVFPVNAAQDGWVATTGFLVLRPKSNVDISYVCNLIKAPFVLRQIRALLISPSMPTISEFDFLSMAVPVTDQATRDEKNRHINQILKEEESLSIELEEVLSSINSLKQSVNENIFNLLSAPHFKQIKDKAGKIKERMESIEEALQ